MDAVETAMPDIDLGDAPDVGKAVADLANKVNGEDIQQTLEKVDDSHSSPTFTAAASVLTGGGLMAALGAKSNGTLESGTSDAPVEAEAESQVAPEQAHDAAPTEEAPSEPALTVISLSGLAATEEDLSITTDSTVSPESVTVGLDAPVLETVPETLENEASRAATIIADVEKPEVSEDIEEKIAGLKEQITSTPDELTARANENASDLAAQAEAAIAPEEAEEIQAPAAPEAPVEDVAEEEAPQKKTKPKRFNPWI